MTFDPMRNGRSNRDRRDQAFARSMISEATRRHNNDVACREQETEDARETTYALDQQYDIGASNASTDAYWQRVGGHPDVGEIDSEDVPQCPWCGEPLPVGVREEYCSVQCAVSAEAD
jgi:hypothetical protein